MVEKTIIKHLSSCLAVRAYMERPKEAPSEYVLIERTGSSHHNHVGTATLAVRAVSTSLAKAADLLEKVESAMEALPHDAEIRGVKLISDYNNTNTVLDIYRYQAVYEIYYNE